MSCNHDIQPDGDYGEPTCVKCGVKQSTLMPISKPTGLTKVIFLDCDGVVCTARSHIVLGYSKGERIWSQWDPIACEAIRLACERGIKLVISSTWRYADPELLSKRLTEFNLRQYVHMPENEPVVR